MKFSCSNSHFWVPRIKVWYNGAAEVGVGNDSIVWFIDVKGRHFVSGSPGLGWLQQEPYSLHDRHLFGCFQNLSDGNSCDKDNGN